MKRIRIVTADRPDDVFKIVSSPRALIVDLEGTLTGFAPTLDSLSEAAAHFDALAQQHGVDLTCVHYVSNAKIIGDSKIQSELFPRVHCRAHKPFFSPPAEVRACGSNAVVIGDQFLTDGLLAWRYGFSFCVIAPSRSEPAWPRIQRKIGQIVLHWLFRCPTRSRTTA
jgi:predicted HAD superfamily phosphohydrolase YqeG